ncbi:MAG: VOC family protein [Rhodoferax sp.]
MADVPSPMNPVGWFEIYVTDMARARKFYIRAAGFFV